jgi:hypothetical protein
MDICISGGVTTDDESWELELEKGERHYLASNWTYTLVIVSEPHRKTYNYTISTTPSRPTNDLLRCVRGLYMTLCPHSLHLILSVVFIAVFAPQSTISYLPFMLVLGAKYLHRCILLFLVLLVGLSLAYCLGSAGCSCCFATSLRMLI